MQVERNLLHRLSAGCVWELFLFARERRDGEITSNTHLRNVGVFRFKHVRNVFERVLK